MNNEILIFGIGGHAKVVHDIVQKQGSYQVASFLSLDSQTQTFLNKPHYSQDQLENLKCNKGVVAIGDNFIRSKVVELILKIKPDFEFVTLVHPSVSIAEGVKLGKGTVVMAQVCINSDSLIGDHVILNSSSSIDHDNKIANFASIAPGVILGGDVQVGAFSAVSLGAKVIHGKKIGENTVVGAGSVVLTDIESNKLAFGSPCKVVRERNKGEKYL